MSHDARPPDDTPPPKGMKQIAPGLYVAEKSNSIFAPVEPVAPDDTPTRLQAGDFKPPADAKEWTCQICGNDALWCHCHTNYSEIITSLRAEVSSLREALDNMESGDDLQRLRAEQAEAEVSRLQQEHARLQAENGLLKRSLGILERTISEAEGR